MCVYEEAVSVCVCVCVSVLTLSGLFMLGLRPSDEPCKQNQRLRKFDSNSYIDILHTLLTNLHNLQKTI